MKKLPFFIFTALFCAGAFAQDLPKAAGIAPAQLKQRIAVLPSVGDLDPTRLILLTDKVREIATENLPMEDFTILKQDVITKLIGAEELYRACKEGVCIGDLAKKTDANYGARCDVVKLDDNRLVLKFEIYSVNEEAIFETFTDYNVKDFYGMLAVLEKRLPNTFKKVAGVQNKALADAGNKAAEQQRQEQQKLELEKALADARDKAIEQQKQEAKAQQEKPTPAPVPEPPQEPPETYTVAADPPAAAARPPSEEKPAHAAQPAKTPKKALPFKHTLRVTGGVAGGIGLIGGLLTDYAIKDALDRYGDFGTPDSPKGTDAESFSKVKEMRKDIDNKIFMRNALYVLTAVGLSGFAVTFFF
jgi:hypothetical protein